MTARFRVHTDGREAAFRQDPDSHDRSRPGGDLNWHVLYPDGSCEWATDADVHGEGWSEAVVLVVLPEPTSLSPLDGVPRWVVERPDRDSWVVFGLGSADEHRRIAAAELAAAAWVEQHTPVPLATGRDREI